MPEVRIFNPQLGARKGGEHAMAYKKKHHHRRRKNPLGFSSGTMKDAVFVAGGAVASAALPGLIVPGFSSGWEGVAATGVAAVGVSFLAKMVGGEAAASEALKGGLAAMVIKALHQAGVGKNLGMGLYAPSWFGIPTSSNQYLQASGANMQQYRRGQGTIFFPGPGAAVPALPAPAAGVSGMGYHRFRSRYSGGYG